jgi:FkbM family methyltransferase
MLPVPSFRPIVDTLASLTRRLPSLRGRGAIAQWLYAHTTRDLGMWSIPMTDGTMMMAPRSAAMSWTPAFTGAYDPSQLDLILSFFTPDSFALDIGACLGFYSVPMGKAALGRGGQVIAFEALPTNERVLRENLARNGLEGVVASVPIGLGSKSTAAEMLVEVGGTGNAFIRTKAFQDPSAPSNLGINVVVERLDTLPVHQWTSKTRCSLIKMDIEGYELDALGGAEAFIAKHRPTIFGEFNPWFLERHGYAAGAPIDWALANGYQCFDLLPSRRSRFSDRVTLRRQLLARGDTRAGGDLLMVPSERVAALEL